jgi:MFS family permease
MQSSSPNPTDQEKIKALPWCLAASVLNGIFGLWTFCGSVFLLFLSALGLPKGQIGTLLALFPFCGVLALGIAPLVTRLGRKRVYLAGYGSRKFVMASLLLLPWILSAYGSTPAMVFLFSVIGVFAVLRVMAETAYYPWQQEFVPNRVRGKFTAWQTWLGLLFACLALMVAGQVIGPGTDLKRFFILIAAGSALGFIGIMLMLKIPGGQPVREPVQFGAHLANLGEALRDRNFLAYLGGMGGFTVGTMLLIVFLPLYLKEEIQLSAGTVVRLDAVVMIGGILASLGCGGLADRFGSRPVLMPALLLSLLVPLGWLVLPRQLAHPVAWCIALQLIYGIGLYAANLGAVRLLYNGVVPLHKNTAYTAIYYAWMGITGGVAPLIAGGLLAACGDWQGQVGPFRIDGYSILFLLSLLLQVVGGWFYFRVKPDDVHTTRAVLARAWNRIYEWRIGNW